MALKDKKFTGNANDVGSAADQLLTETAYVKANFVDDFETINGRIGLSMRVTFPPELEGSLFREYMGDPDLSDDPNRKVWPFWRGLCESSGRQFKKGMSLAEIAKQGPEYHCYFIHRDDSDSGYDERKWLRPDAWQRRYEAFAAMKQRVEVQVNDPDVSTVDTSGVLDDLDEL